MKILNWTTGSLAVLLALFTCGACTFEPRASGGKSAIVVPIVAPTSIYAVPVGTSPTNLRGFVSDAIKQYAPESMKATTLNKLGTPSIKIELWRKDQIPSVIFDMLLYSGSSGEDVNALSRAKNFIVITGVGKPGWPPLHEIECQTVAASVAKALKTSAMDLYLPKSVSVEDVLNVSHSQQRNPRFYQWSKVLNSDSSNGLWMTTRGLARIGLLEVQSIDVPPQLEDSWSYVMSGLCWKLAKLSNAELKAGKQEVELPSIIALTDKDLGDAFASPVSLKENTSTRLFLKIARGVDEADYITIVQPNGDKRKFGEYVVDVTRELLGAHENQGVISKRSEAMDKAIATAKAELPSVRKRFLNKEFPFYGRLILKFRIEKGDDREFLWAYVTGWKDPKKIQAYCGNDSEFDPRLRSGQVLNLDVEKIVDWALMEKNDIVQGGYTIKVLQHEHKELK